MKQNKVTTQSVSLKPHGVELLESTRTSSEGRIDELKRLHMVQGQQFGDACTQVSQPLNTNLSSKLAAVWENCRKKPEGK